MAGKFGRREEIGGFTMSQKYNKLLTCLGDVRAKTDFIPKLGLVLGSGLGDYAEEIQVVASIDYQDITGFPTSTVQGHKGRFIFGYIDTVPVVIMQGRVHYYEGYSMEDVVLPIRLMKLLGIETLFLTNAAGGLNETYKAGDFMVIEDQISSFIPSPLIGSNIEELGARFSDMSEIYSKKFIKSIETAADELGVEVKKGVYLQTSGPNYESPAEVKMFRQLGADAVGMSTVCEAIAGRHMNLNICGISCISNLASGMTEEPLSHEEVQDTANRVAPLFKSLITKSIISIGTSSSKDK
jgi:purine-nucleoside phosphorylase